MDYSMMLYGALGFVAIVGVVGVAAVVWRRKKKKKMPEEIYPMW